MMKRATRGHRRGREESTMGPSWTDEEINVATGMRSTGSWERQGQAQHSGKELDRRQGKTPRSSGSDKDEGTGGCSTGGRRTTGEVGEEMNRQHVM
jgi:hypothetical protein